MITMSHGSSQLLYIATAVLRTAALNSQALSIAFDSDMVSGKYDPSQPVSKLDSIC